MRWDGEVEGGVEERKDRNTYVYCVTISTAVTVHRSSFTNYSVETLEMGWI